MIHTIQNFFAETQNAMNVIKENLIHKQFECIKNKSADDKDIRYSIELAAITSGKSKSRVIHTLSPNPFSAEIENIEDDEQVELEFLTPDSKASLIHDLNCSERTSFESSVPDFRNTVCDIVKNILRIV